MKLTKAMLEQLETNGKRYTVFDGDLKGFAVRVGAGGEKVFYYVYRAGKGRAAPVKWLRLGSFPALTCELARVLAKAKAACVALGADPLQDGKAGKTAPLVKDAMELFYTQHVADKLKNSSRMLYRGIIDNNILPAIGALKVADVEQHHMAALHHAMRETPYMANRACAVASGFFSWAEKNGYRPRNTNPIRGIAKYSEHKRSSRMDAEELTRMGAALTALERAWHERERIRRRKEKIPLGMVAITPTAANAIRLLCLTGARLGEILALRWDDLDLDTGRARLPDSKLGTRALHLPWPAVAVLSGMNGDSAWVFPNRKGDGHMSALHYAWRILCKKAGLDGWRIHDLRHALASASVNSAHAPPQITALLGRTQPENAMPPDTLWFIFHNTSLLLRPGGQGASALPHGAEPPLPPAGALHQLGQYHNQACVAYHTLQPPDPQAWDTPAPRSAYALIEPDLHAFADKGFARIHWDRQSQYCSACGTPAQPSTDLAKNCPACGRKMFPTLIPAVLVLVRKQDSILLAAHAHSCKEPVYSLLQGRLEPGESLEACVHRSVFEATGATVDQVSFFGSQCRPCANILLIGFIADYASGTPQWPEKQLVSSGFYTRDTLPRLPGRFSLSRRMIDWWRAQG